LQYIRFNFNLGYSFRNRRKVKIVFAYNGTDWQSKKRLNFKPEVLSLNLVGEEIFMILQALSLYCKANSQITVFTLAIGVSVSKLFQYPLFRFIQSPIIVTADMMSINSQQNTYPKQSVFAEDECILQG
jgi:hypothetical protein